MDMQFLACDSFHPQLGNYLSFLMQEFSVCICMWQVKDKESVRVSLSYNIIDAFSTLQ